MNLLDDVVKYMKNGNFDGKIGECDIVYVIPPSTLEVDFTTECDPGGLTFTVEFEELDTDGECLVEKVEKEQGAGVRVFFSPQGVPLTQPLVRQLSAMLFPFDTISPVRPE